MDDKKPPKLLLTCEDIPKVAMDAMNGVHCEELEIVNALVELLNQPQPLDETDTAIDQYLNEWLAHTEAHFSRENSLMEKYGFPAYHCHLQEHEQALKQLQSILNLWFEKRDKPTLAQYAQCDWPNWFVNHIATMDVVTSAYIYRKIQEEGSAG